MKKILQHRSKRDGYDGWAIQHRISRIPWASTFCTTRRECREIRDGMDDYIRSRTEIVKVKLELRRL